MRTHLIDLLAGAVIDAPARSYVNIQPITIGRVTRMSIFQHPNSAVRFPEIEVYPGLALNFGYGVKQACWRKIRSAIEFRISALDSDGHVHPIFKNVLAVQNEKCDRLWHDARVALDKFKGKKLVFIFETFVSGDNSYCWSGWSDPYIDSDTDSKPVIDRKIKAAAHAQAAGRSSQSGRDRAAKPNILMITADALRMDFLGCYGHPFVKTPNLDRLAQEGVLFSHARAQTPTTLGSYASILTGAQALEHQVLAEWGHIRPGLPTLPQRLSEAGYHSLIATSEAELGEDRDGFVRFFDEEIHCLAVPAQSGEITSRQFCRWLQGRPNKPFFAWLQFFDTHPPSTPPPPFNTMYYQQDPSNAVAEYNSNLLRSIHGVESCLRIKTTLDQLKRGRLDTDMLKRLEATADVLSGRGKHGPDLVSLLTSLGEKACNGMDEERFSNWLTNQVNQLHKNEISSDLISWLTSLLPHLEEVEADIMAWLDGVVDFRYPLSQYMGEVSFLDHVIGQIVGALKEEQLYDNTVILFTSPHGELLDEEGLYFHHHALMEQVLRIPAILKPPASLEIKRGCQIGGIFDQIDVMPTLLEAAGIAPEKASCRGQSRLVNLRSGRDIDAHDSIATDIHAASYALSRPPFVYIRAIKPYFVSEKWKWNAGDRALYRMQTPMSYAENLIDRLPGTAKELDDALSTFLARQKPGVREHELVKFGL